jgi:hypothetical protein
MPDSRPQSPRTNTSMAQVESGKYRGRPCCKPTLTRIPTNLYFPSSTFHLIPPSRPDLEQNPPRSRTTIQCSGIPSWTQDSRIRQHNPIPNAPSFTQLRAAKKDYWNAQDEIRTDNLSSEPKVLYHCAKQRPYSLLLAQSFSTAKASAQGPDSGPTRALGCALIQPSPQRGLDPSARSHNSGPDTRGPTRAPLHAAWTLASGATTPRIATQPPKGPTRAPIPRILTFSTILLPSSLIFFLPCVYHLRAVSRRFLQYRTVLTVLRSATT